MHKISNNMVSVKISSVSVYWKQEYKKYKEFSLLGDKQVIEIAMENALLKLYTYIHAYMLKYKI